MYLRTKAAALFLMLGALSTASGKSGIDAKSLVFLKADSVDVATLLPIPSSPDSVEGKCEIGVLLSLQATRTPADVERAKAEEKITVNSFTGVVGPWFTSENLPKTEAFWKAIEKEAKLFTNEGKDQFKRPRPMTADARLKPVFDETDDGYPSGHATRGMLFALILSEIFPEQKAKLIAQGEQIGWDRVVAGVHYPSDIFAGRVLGRALANGILASPAFKEQLPAIRAEIAAAQHAAAAAPAAAPAMAVTH